MKFPKIKHKLIAHASKTRRMTFPYRRCQSGQALIITLFFALVLSYCLFLVYNTGKLSTAKRDLVGAADAAAYSGASVIAQGLNYTAYTNRAISGNNALIAQMTGVRSILGMSDWYWSSSKTVFEALQVLAPFMPHFAPIVTAFARASGRFAGYWKSNIIKPARIFAEVLGYVSQSALGLGNGAMWVSQQIVLAESLISFEPHMIKIAKENAPEAIVDTALHATAFGPIATAGMFAHKFKVNIRKNKRTQGTHDADKDDYLQYFTDSNRNTNQPAFVLGRKKLPNAVGLWAATGCSGGEPAITGGLSGLFTPAVVNDFGGAANIAVTAVDTYLSLVGLFLNPIMCLYDRSGGSEMVQLEDGKLAWVAVDVMDFKVPLFNIGIPFAGGAAMSFVDDDKKRRGPAGAKAMPDSLAYFEDRLEAGALLMPTQKYLGEHGTLPPDCVEFVNPINRDMIALSTDTRWSGNCAVINPGSTTAGKDKGIYAGPMKDTARKTLRSGDPSSPAAAIINGLTETLTANLTTALGPLENALTVPSISDTISTSGIAIPMPGGLSSSAASSASSGLPNVAGLLSAGGAMLASPFIAAKDAFTSAAGNIAATSNPVNFLNFNVNVVDLLRAGAGFRPGIPGMGIFSILAGMDISDGVDVPRNAILNTALNVLADGLPPYIWDIRTSDPVMGRANHTQAKEIWVTDGDYQDYHERRYNLGPIVYMPLMHESKKIKTTEVMSSGGSGGKIISLPDYHGRRDAIKALGKARIHWNQPHDRWQTRLKRVVTANLTQPYWQVRNESLSYVDKWGLLLLDGLSGQSTDIAGKVQNEIAAEIEEDK